MATIQQRVSQLERRNPPPTDHTPIHALRQLTDKELDTLETLLTTYPAPSQAEELIHTALTRHHARSPTYSTSETAGSNLEQIH